MNRIPMSNQQRAYEAAATGMSWAEVATTVGYKNAASANASASIYARNNNKSWPPESEESSTVRLPQGNSRTERAYKMRADGLKWAVITKALGYNTVTSCANTCRSWAASNGKPWPVPKGFKPASPAPAPKPVETTTETVTTLPTRDDLLRLLYSTAQGLADGTADHNRAYALVQVVETSLDLIGE